jgi:hypothetical protein
MMGNIPEKVLRGGEIVANTTTIYGQKWDSFTHKELVQLAALGWRTAAVIKYGEDDDEYLSITAGGFIRWMITTSVLWGSGYFGVVLGVQGAMNVFLSVAGMLGGLAILAGFFTKAELQKPVKPSEYTVLHAIRDWVVFALLSWSGSFWVAGLYFVYMAVAYATVFTQKAGLEALYHVHTDD